MSLESKEELLRNLNREETGYLQWMDAFNEAVLNWRNVLTAQVTTREVTVAGYSHRFTLQSNSTISGLSYDEAVQTLDFMVLGPDNTRGFCGVVVPRSLISGTPAVLIDGRQVSCQYGVV
jgi:hypothetical protein